MKALKLYHLRREAQPSFLKFGKDVWVAAESPEMALAHSSAELGLDTRGPVTIYDYTSGPAGIVSLGDSGCECVTYSEEEQRRVFEKHAHLRWRISRYAP